MWLKESEDVTWERFIEALTSIQLDDLAKAVKEKFCSPPETEEVSKPSEQTFRDKVSETVWCSFALRPIPRFEEFILIVLLFLTSLFCVSVRVGVFQCS
jgi:hypothetical protein